MDVTERAKNHLKNSLSSVKSMPKSDACFRLTKDGDAFRIGVDVPGPADETFTLGDETVLAVEPDVASQCEGMTLDLDTSKGSAELFFLPTPPAA